MMNIDIHVYRQLFFVLPTIFGDHTSFYGGHTVFIISGVLGLNSEVTKMIISP